MNPEIQFRNKYQPDYSGMNLTEIPFCNMPDYRGNLQVYRLDLITDQQETDPIRPVVFFIHGGGFTQPCDKRQAYISLFARDLTRMGFCVVSPDYPLFDDEQHLASAGGETAAYAKAAEAIHLAYAFLSEKSETLRLDMKHVSIIGGSAGAMAAFHAIGNYPEDHYQSFINCWGAPLTLPETNHFPPTLSIHGDADMLVSYDRESQVQEAFVQAGIRHRLITLPAQGHTPLGKYAEFLPEIRSWLCGSGV